jgi:NAD(P)-dependent dehydrogenase (short-subunit alcohol dehydrogenase family)
VTDATPGIQQNLDPVRWREHRFGLTPARWAALAGQCFWITGAGTGFGRSMAVALAAAGARVVLSGRRNEKLLESIGEMRGLGIPTADAIPLMLDVTDARAVAAAVVEIEQRCARLNGLVCSAALPQAGDGPFPLMSMSPERWESLLRTNVTGSWLVTRAALPLMLKGASARVVYLTSEAGWAFTPGFGAYNVTKGALNNLGASFAAECEAQYPEADVQINVLVPGEARTEMNRGSTDSPYAIACMALALLSHPPGGPNGYFFHRDGRHLSFAYRAPYQRPLLDG